MSFLPIEPLFLKHIAWLPFKHFEPLAFLPTVLSFLPIGGPFRSIVWQPFLSIFRLPFLTIGLLLFLPVGCQSSLPKGLWSFLPIPIPKYHLSLMDFTSPCLLDDRHSSLLHDSDSSLLDDCHSSLLGGYQLSLLDGSQTCLLEDYCLSLLDDGLVDNSHPVYSTTDLPCLLGNYHLCLFDDYHLIMLTVIAAYWYGKHTVQPTVI